MSPRELSPKDLILEALEKPEWEWRTVEGLSTETGIPLDEVLQILENSPEEVILSSRPGPKGRPLYTSRRHYTQKQSLLNRFRST